MNSQSGILGIETALRTGAPCGGMQVQQLTVFGQRLKTVSEAFGNEQGFVVFSAKDLRVPFQKRGATPAEVDSHVKHFALEAAYYFGLRMGWKLKVHAPNPTSLLCQAAIDLKYGFISQQGQKLFGTEHSLQVAAVVTDRRALDQLEAIQRRAEDVKTRTHASPADS